MVGDELGTQTEQAIDLLVATVPERGDVEMHPFLPVLGSGTCWNHSPVAPPGATSDASGSPGKSSSARGQPVISLQKPASS